MLNKLRFFLAVVIFLGGIPFVLSHDSHVIRYQDQCIDDKNIMLNMSENIIKELTAQCFSEREVASVLEILMTDKGCSNCFDDFFSGFVKGVISAGAIDLLIGVGLLVIGWGIGCFFCTGMDHCICERCRSTREPNEEQALIS